MQDGDALKDGTKAAAYTTVEDNNTSKDNQAG
jgi:hypothetical protein